jgi:methionine-rich copper-binding protein CopC
LRAGTSATSAVAALSVAVAMGGHLLVAGGPVPAATVPQLAALAGACWLLGEYLAGRAEHRGPDDPCVRERSTIMSGTSLQRALRRPAALLAATLLTLVASTGVAAAHAKLESMTPADGSTVAHPPKSVVLRFTEPVGAAGPDVVVTAPNGANVATGAAEVVDRVVTQPLGVLTEAGRYQVEARVVSDDGHPITVTGTFTVTQADRSSGQAVAPAGNPPDSSSSPGVLIGVMVLVMLVVVALAIVIVRRHPAPESQ